MCISPVFPRGPGRTHLGSYANKETAEAVAAIADNVMAPKLAAETAAADAALAELQSGDLGRVRAVLRNDAVLAVKLVECAASWSGLASTRPWRGTSPRLP